MTSGCHRSLHLRRRLIVDINNGRLSETNKLVPVYSEKAYMHLCALSSEEECIQCTAVSAKVFPRRGLSCEASQGGYGAFGLQTLDEPHGS